MAVNEAQGEGREAWNHGRGTWNSRMVEPGQGMTSGHALAGC